MGKGYTLLIMNQVLLGQKLIKVDNIFILKS